MIISPVDRSTPKRQSIAEDDPSRCFQGARAAGCFRLPLSYDQNRQSGAVFDLENFS
jgi:hypothetical protein